MAHISMWYRQHRHSYTVNAVPKFTDLVHSLLVQTRIKSKNILHFRPQVYCTTRSPAGHCACVANSVKCTFSSKMCYFFCTFMFPPQSTVGKVFRCQMWKSEMKILYISTQERQFLIPLKYLEPFLSGGGVKHSECKISTSFTGDVAHGWPDLRRSVLQVV